ncbi:MAG: hypothetical protein PHX03_05065 [Bacilli bacterium]|nr:hypothetical protein [Bacilli bacterium]
MKYISSTYLKDITDYTFKLFFDKTKDYYITVKKINKIKAPFILEEDEREVIIIDNGYYILEYIPLNEKYICRVHIDKEKNVVERFFIASRQNKVENRIPTFEDLKLSLVCIDDIVKMYNLNLVNDLVNKKEMSFEDYQLALQVMENISKELELKSNFIFNLNYEEYLED